MTRHPAPQVRVLTPDPLSPADRVLLFVRTGDETDAHRRIADWIAGEIAGGFGDHFDLQNPPVVLGLTDGIWRWMPNADEGVHLTSAAEGPGAFRGFLVELGQPARVGRFT